jgi:N-acetylneuraminic acid mutarotase
MTEEIKNEGNIWKKLKSIKKGLRRGTLNQYKEKLYFFGGYDQKKDKSTNSLYEYDPLSE